MADRFSSANLQGKDVSAEVLIQIGENDFLRYMDLKKSYDGGSITAAGSPPTINYLLEAKTTSTGAAPTLTRAEKTTAAKIQEICGIKIRWVGWDRMGNIFVPVGGPAIVIAP